MIFSSEKVLVWTPFSCFDNKYQLCSAAFIEICVNETLHSSVEVDFTDPCSATSSGSICCSHEQGRANLIAHGMEIRDESQNGCVGCEQKVDLFNSLGVKSKTVCEREFCGDLSLERFTAESDFLSDFVI